ncbi:hypothetical protein WMF04_29110 [Sorangium sp. So ce260]|uniref:hypothetical protein n=1 Tax=Sorangium sp. So ce260 TaxID=3133291 RepID=UPI003F5E0757
MHHAWSITVKRAVDRTETWISDRTGHSSSDQIRNYKRAARKVAELALGDLAPLDEVLPELSGKGGAAAGGGPVSGEPGAGTASDEGSLAAAPPCDVATRSDVAGALAVAMDAPEDGRVGQTGRGPGRPQVGTN